MMVWMRSYEPHPSSNNNDRFSLRSSSSSSSSKKLIGKDKDDDDDLPPTNLMGWHTLPPLVVNNADHHHHHGHQFVLVMGSTSSGSKLVTSLCAQCLGLTDSIRHGQRHGGYGDLFLRGQSDVVLHRSLPHGYGQRPTIVNATTLDMLLGRHGEMFIDPLMLGQLASEERNYKTVKYVVVVRDERTSIVSSVANRHARGFDDARDHMRRAQSIMNDLIMTKSKSTNNNSSNNTSATTTTTINDNVLVVDYEGLVQYWDPIWKTTISNFLHCPVSRFDTIDQLKDGNQKYVFSIKACINEILFRLRIL